MPTTETAQVTPRGVTFFETATFFDFFAGVVVWDIQYLFPSDAPGSGNIFRIRLLRFGPHSIPVHATQHNATPASSPHTTQSPQQPLHIWFDYSTLRPMSVACRPQSLYPQALAYTCLCTESRMGSRVVSNWQLAGNSVNAEDNPRSHHHDTSCSPCFV